MAQTINQTYRCSTGIVKKRRHRRFHYPQYRPAPKRVRSTVLEIKRMDIRLHRSAGTAVITSDKAGLWTDSRYFLQAEQQLEGSGIDLYKEMLPETPSILDFLRENLTANSVVGIDGKVFSTTQAIALQEDLAKTTSP